jgi:hypothetical protein
MAKFSKGDKVDVRYKDGARYPAVIVNIEPRRPDYDPEDGDTYIVRWEPPDPNIPPTWTADEDSIRRLK